MWKRIIPFLLLPTSWGRSGKDYEEAQARYTLTGEALERRLIDIHHGDDPAKHSEMHLRLDNKLGRLTDYDLAVKVAELRGENDPKTLLNLAYAHQKIGDYELARGLAEIEHPEGTERDLALLAIDRKFEKIGEKDYEKEAATLRKEPWIGIINDGFDLQQGLNGVFFEFDWNSFWIDYLTLNGYTGRTEEEIVEKWFQDVCRSTAAESIADEEENFLFGRGTNRIPRGNGRADYL